MDPVEELKQATEKYETLDDLVRVACGEFGNPMYQVRCAKRFGKIHLEMEGLRPVPKQSKKPGSIRLIDLLDRPYAKRE